MRTATLIIALSMFGTADAQCVGGQCYGGQCHRGGVSVSAPFTRVRIGGHHRERHVTRHNSSSSGCATGVNVNVGCPADCQCGCQAGGQCDCRTGGEMKFCGKCSCFPCQCHWKFPEAPSEPELSPRDVNIDVDKTNINTGRQKIDVDVEINK